MFKPKIGEIIPYLLINGIPVPYPVVDDKAVRAGEGVNVCSGGVCEIRKD